MLPLIFQDSFSSLCFSKVLLKDGIYRSLVSQTALGLAEKQIKQENVSTVTSISITSNDNKHKLIM